MSDTDDRQVLEALVFAPELEQLENLIAEFNIFEALGAVRQELRHSDFLAFLLNPNENHSLGERFLKRFLRAALHDAPEPPLNPIELDLIDMDSALVLREWRSIDILIDDHERNNLVVVIENKIDTGEHSNQLQRYFATAQKHFPGATLVPIFLTPEGDEPSEDAYIPLSYDAVADVIDALLTAQASTMGPDVRTITSHYVTMLRRHIVSESEIANLCRKIYRRHQRALDLLFEYRPDLKTEVFEFLVDLIDHTPGLSRDHSSKSSISFGLVEWDQVTELKTSSGWTRSGRILLFEFTNRDNSLSLKLIIGPGPSDIREKLYELADNNRRLFERCSKSLYPKWTTIYSVNFLRTDDYESASIDDLTPKIDAAWQRFLDTDLPRIRDFFLNADLPPVEPDADSQ